MSCPDRVGIVHSVAGFLAERTINIVDSKQFADLSTGRFFMRVQAVPPAGAQLEVLRQEFGALAEQFAMTFELHDARERPRVLVLVSRLGHCLNDLLYRHSIGALKAEMVAIVSNHRDFEELARSSGIDFHYLPITSETKEAQEAKLRTLVDELRVDLVVLARYMQILTEPTVEQLAGPGDKHPPLVPAQLQRSVPVPAGLRAGREGHRGHRPLRDEPARRGTDHRAGGRPLDHAHSPEQLAEVGRDIECVTLARAVRWHISTG